MTIKSCNHQPAAAAAVAWREIKTRPDKKFIDKTERGIIFVSQLPTDFSRQFNPYFVCCKVEVSEGNGKQKFSILHIPIPEYANDRPH